MESVEDSARIVGRKGYLQHAVLSAVAISGILLVAMAAPNTLQLLGGLSRKHQRRFPEEARSAIGRLVKKGHVVFEGEGKYYARITESGRRELERQEIRIRFTSAKKKRWDKRYRLIMFDISEKRKAARNQLRREMNSWGFLRLQDSVWVYPHDCEDVVTLLKAELRLGREVVYAVVESIENDRWIREHFDLPRF